MHALTITCVQITLVGYVSETIEPIASLLLTTGALIDRSNKFTGESLLHLAVLRQQPALVRLLLQLGCPSDKKDNEQRSALYCASTMFVNDPKMVEIVELLVKAGADVNNGPPRDPTPLVAAVRNGRLGTVLALLSSPTCEVDKPGNHDDRERQITALSLAIYQGGSFFDN